MADTSNLTSFLGDVADAIREKKGTTEEIPAEQFDTEILSIETGGTEINNQDKTVTENGVYIADEGYTGLGEVTVNVQADGVKLFKTEEEMQSDTTAEEGDLAVVYGKEDMLTIESSQFQIGVFPKTVILPSRPSMWVSDMGMTGYQYVDTTLNINSPMGRLSVQPTYMNFSMAKAGTAGNTLMYITYSSEDGITYTVSDTSSYGLVEEDDRYVCDFESPINWYVRSRIRTLR